jgi:Glycosyl transferases group 1
MIKKIYVILKHFRSIVVVFLFEKPVYNYFKTKFSKTVLLSYITKTFYLGKSYGHTNTVEVLTMAKIFKNLGYNIDVFNYNHDGPNDYSKYNVILGFGTPLINSFYKSTKKILTVYYGTGMHICHQNHATLSRINDVYKKRHVWMPESGRVVEKAWSEQTTLVDGMIVLGNEICASSYRKYYDGPVFPLKASFIEVISDEEVFSIIEHKNYDEAKKHFLWFGSTGLIHKGLDLLLELFEKRGDWHLHICGPISKEVGFEKEYFSKLYNCPNIHTYGFINIKSDVFKDLMQKCGSIISPSCSEGGSPAVLNCMANGLIPIITEYCSIDIKDFGFYIKELKEEGVLEALNKVILLSKIELKGRALKTFRYTRKNHNITEFERNFGEIIKKILVLS